MKRLILGVLFGVILTCSSGVFIGIVKQHKAVRAQEEAARAAANLAAARAR